MIKLLIAAWLLFQQPVDLQQSIVYWKGTKMHGTGYHEGTLKLRSGDLSPTGGSFEIDMNRLRVTDTPPRETVPLNALTKHLKEEFDVAHYPTIKFTMTKIDASLIKGNLNIMGLTKPISFPVKKVSTGYEASLTISRKDWGIGKRASWLENKLVDDLIQLRIDLRMAAR